MESFLKYYKLERFLSEVRTVAVVGGAYYAQMPMTNRQVG